MNKNDFTRDRKLPFSKMIITIAKKSVKSIQNVLNETQIYLSKLSDENLETISNSAYCQARNKLNYTAFIELANDARAMFYRDYDYKRYKGFRLLAVDGSIISLPNSEDIKKGFSVQTFVNQIKDKAKNIVQARVSILYDVLNNVVIDSSLVDFRISESVIVKDFHLKEVQKNDLILFDRGYPSFELFTTITNKYNANYLFRIQKKGYKEVQFMFEEECTVNDKIVTLKPYNSTLKKKLLQMNLPVEIEVRFVRVVLDDGEIEVLATSILNNDIIRTDEFKELYFLRWEIETYYDLIKNRLSLENFSGTSVLSVMQDFHATIFITNLEILFTFDMDKELSLNSNNNKYTQKINKAVSFNTIKNYCFDLLYSNRDISILYEEMSLLFLTNKTAIKPNRKFKRYTSRHDRYSRGGKSVNYQKRNKKNVF